MQKCERSVVHRLVITTCKDMQQSIIYPNHTIPAGTYSSEREKREREEEREEERGKKNKQSKHSNQSTMA